MVLLTTTPQILKSITALPPSSDLRTEISLPSELGAPISHDTLIALSKSSPNSTLNDLLLKTQIYKAPPPVKTAPSPEYVALMARLRVEQEHRDYKTLLEKQAHEERKALFGHDPEEQKDDISPSLVLNILLSVVMCAGVAFHLTRWWPNEGVRVLVSLGTGIVVGVAEVTVYAAYLRKVDESRSKERKLKEKKEFIGEYTGPADAADVRGVRDGEQMEVVETKIWGKGINGGMRRRVREQWEKNQDTTQ